MSGETTRKNLSQIVDNNVDITYHKVHHFLTESTWDYEKINEQRLKNISFGDRRNNKLFFYQAMKINQLLLLGISWLNLNLVVQANPTLSTQSYCQASVNYVIRQINNKGVSRVKFYVYPGVANEYHYGNPTSRNDVLSIVLGGYGTPETEYPKLANILYSAVLMNSWANEIVKNCGNTAVVSFGEDQTDWIIQYAIQENGLTKLRDCVAPPAEKLTWNQQYCL